jgi:hypothetical protein
MVTLSEIDGLPPAELPQLVLTLLEENAEQTRAIAKPREEIAEFMLATDNTFSESLPAQMVRPAAAPFSTELPSCVSSVGKVN